MKILVTGANGFIGKNLISQLSKRTECQILRYDRAASPATQAELVARADLVYHLAGVNRPLADEEFMRGNFEFTTSLCEQLAQTGRPVPLVYASSIQATLDNPYGVSKRQSEDVVQSYGDQTQSPVAIYRLPNVFGKWARPNYNSVVATFCHNLTHGLPLTITDATRALDLVYIDDVVSLLLNELTLTTSKPSTATSSHTSPRRAITPRYTLTVQELADILQSFQQMRATLQIPNFSDPLQRKLYATYLAYLEHTDFAYALEQRIDPRGSLAEFIKSPTFGQIFVSRTKPGIVRGNHFHHTKTEKFLVLEGQAIIRFQHILSGEIVEYGVRGEDYQVVDIPPGYSHAIENVGTTELVTLFWASELFDPTQPDTYMHPIVEPTP